MLELNSVALCCVDTRTPMLALKAMQRSMQAIHFGDAILFAVPDPELIEHASSSRVRVVNPGQMNSIERYSDFLLRGLMAHVHHEFILVMQWDGFVLHPEAWTDKFFNYDYIGAIWPEGFSRYKVGNGGFSLRSKKLLQALHAADIQATHPEDLCVCDVNREILEKKYGISFAPPAIAALFAYEHIRSSVPTFGFHGAFNLSDAFSAEELLSFLKSMQGSMFFAAGMRTLAKKLINDGQYESAQHILTSRLRQGDRRWRIVSLMLRLIVRRLFRMPPDRLRR